jgi:iron-sulfur cluster assembly protein CyaY
MDDAEFRELSDACLDKVAKWLEDFDPDEVDYSSADGVVNIEFADGARFVLSRQSQMKQMWLAAGAHGFHYNWEPASATWLDDKDGHDLFESLARAISEQVGHPVES